MLIIATIRAKGYSGCAPGVLSYWSTGPFVTGIR